MDSHYRTVILRYIGDDAAPAKRRRVYEVARAAIAQYFPGGDNAETRARELARFDRAVLEVEASFVEAPPPDSGVGVASGAPPSIGAGAPFEAPGAAAIASSTIPRSEVASPVVAPSQRDTAIPRTAPPVPPVSEPIVPRFGQDRPTFDVAAPDRISEDPSRGPAPESIAVATPPPQPPRQPGTTMRDAPASATEAGEPWPIHGEPNTDAHGEASLEGHGRAHRSPDWSEGPRGGGEDPGGGLFAATASSEPERVASDGEAGGSSILDRLKVVMLLATIGIAAYFAVERYRAPSPTPVRREVEAARPAGRSEARLDGAKGDATWAEGRDPPTVSLRDPTRDVLKARVESAAGAFSALLIVMPAEGSPYPRGDMIEIRFPDANRPRIANVSSVRLMTRDDKPIDPEAVIVRSGGSGFSLVFPKGDIPREVARVLLRAARQLQIGLTAEDGGEHRLNIVLPPVFAKAFGG